MLPQHPIRTLPFHLNLQAMLWLSAETGLMQWKQNSAQWKQNWQSFAGMLPMMPDEQKLESAVRQQLANQNISLLKAVHRYQTHPFQRPESQAEVIWQNGTTRLLDFGAGLEKPKASVLFVPSLINRYYILDLLPERSFIRHLLAQNIRPLVVDWQNPGEEEQCFTCGDYVMQRLLPAIKAASGKTPLILAGYCMGGLLALAGAQLGKTPLAGLALLATPWDFHSRQFARVRLDEVRTQKLQTLIERAPTIPGEVLQTLFYATNPWVFSRKFIQFGEMEAGSEEAQQFIAVQDWVNDCVPMAPNVARECLIDWVQHNRTVRGQWQACGEAVQPETLSLPTFIACPTHDTVVPADSSEPLLAALPSATLCRPLSGHIGMVAGPNARRELWHPFSAWVHAQI